MLAAALTASFSCGRQTPRPNVILVAIDSLNQRQLEQALRESGAPSIARLAAEAVVFPRAYSHAPWTTPAHMSMLTGLHPSQHGRDIPSTTRTTFTIRCPRTDVPGTWRILPTVLDAVGLPLREYRGPGRPILARGVERGRYGPWAT
jgi:hypothetical protein